MSARCALRWCLSGLWKMHHWRCKQKQNCHWTLGPTILI
jgi:hypothetical protein